MSYKRLDPEDVLISADSTTTSCWTGNNVSLTSFFTSSIQVNSTSGDYYYNVYNYDPILTASANIQFTVGYADKLGSGSILFNSDVATKSPTSTVYGQYRSLVLGTEEEDFVFGTGTNAVQSDYFYVLNIDRGRYKEKLLPGSLELKLSGSGGGITLTDTSTTSTIQTFKDSGRVYELKSNVSGSSIPNSGSYGWLLPDIGTILLNGQALDASVNDGGIALGTDRTNSNAQNSSKLYDAIKDGAGFKLRSEETVSSNFIFIRARNTEFNYSTNPSYITGSGELKYATLIDSPQAYITSVGLYNDNNDLLAVAKLSRPLLKDSTKESLIRIKLNF